MNKELLPWWNRNELIKEFADASWEYTQAQERLNEAEERLNQAKKEIKDRGGVVGELFGRRR